VTDPGREFALCDGRALVLHESGLLHPAAATRRFTPWLEIVHVTLDARALRIAALRGSWRIPRAAFASPHGAGEAYGALRARLAELPDGVARMARQQALDRRLAASGRPFLGPLLAALAVALYLIGLSEPTLAIEGEYWGELGLSGEPWRLVTAQLLHAGVSHLLLNSMALVILAAVLERQLGAGRTALVLAASGVGSMLGCSLAGYDRVVGASGLVAGVAGALLVLEMLRPDLLPAHWRLPRRLLVGAIALDAVLMAFVPNVAHAAHLGGFLAGGALAYWLAPRAVDELRTGPGLRFANALLVVAVALSLGALARGVADPDRAAMRRGERLLANQDTPALTLNNYAWTLAISERPSEHQLEVALKLARRAVRETARSDPNLLDTLAEVYFQSGRAVDALETIDEAIHLAPLEPYFREQRRRFAGDRAAYERPDPPRFLPDPFPDFLPPGIEPDETAPGLRV
jgi:membrane associated rhomboid family serine protease